VSDRGHRAGHRTPGHHVAGFRKTSDGHRSRRTSCRAYPDSVRGGAAREEAIEHADRGDLAQAAHTLAEASIKLDPYTSDPVIV